MQCLSLGCSSYPFETTAPENIREWQRVLVIWSLAAEFTTSRELQVSMITFQWGSCKRNAGMEELGGDATDSQGWMSICCGFMDDASFCDLLLGTWPSGPRGSNCETCLITSGSIGISRGHGVQKIYLRYQKIFKGSNKTYSIFLRWCSVLARLCHFQILWSLNLPVLQSSPLVPWSLGPLVS